MKQTPLFQLHVELGARFGAFAGYDMPLFYPLGVIGEHRHTRSATGLFDISHMVQVELQGSNAAALVAHLCPYPAGTQQTGRSRYSFFLNEDAGMIDDVIVTRLFEDRFLIVCNAGCAQKDLLHVAKHAAGFQVAVTVHERALLAVQGPHAENALSRLAMDVADLDFLDARELAGGRFVSRSGYTGEDGFEIAMATSEIEPFARALLADKSVQMIGLAARDSLRLEAGLSLYGQDLAEDITPMEAGLAWAIPQSHRSGGSFVGAAALARKFAEGRARKRVGLIPDGSAPVRAHAAITDPAGRKVGEVTSGGFGPTVNHPIALGLVETNAGDSLFADLRGRPIGLKQVTLPFVPHNYKHKAN